MPTIYEYKGLIFKFFSDEHYPISIHVTKGKYGNIYELVLVNNQFVELNKYRKKGAEYLPYRYSKRAEEMIRANYQDIVNKWIDYFVRNIFIKPVKIIKKTQL